MFKKNIKIRIPKVFISINLLHPFLRPLTKNKKKDDCYYFQILEMFSVIKRKINEVLADAIRAGNKITINYNENYLYINIICFEDVAYNIANEIKKIIFDTKWNETDFIINNEIYKYETFYNFFNYGLHTLKEVGFYYFYCKLKNGLFNKYEFNKTQFDNDNSCLDEIKNNVEYLNKFMINGLIYGYFNESEARNISDIFERNNNDEKSIIEDLLKKVNNNISIDNFIDWTNEIKELKENDNDNYVNINEKITTKKSRNFGYRFISLSSDTEYNNNYMYLSLIENMLSNIRTEAKNYLVVEMIVFRDLYFSLFLFEPFDHIVNPNNDTFINKMFNIILNDANNAYSQIVDILGDRFYYLQKNLGLVLFKRQSILEEFATEELQYSIYKYSVMNREQIIKEFNEKRENKNYKFEDLKEYILNKKQNKIFDVNTVP